MRGRPVCAFLTYARAAGIVVAARGGLRKLAIVVRNLQRQRAPTQHLELLGRVDCALPLFLLLVDAAQRLQRLDLVAGTLRQPREQVLGTIQQAGMEVVFRQRVKRLVSLFRGQVGTRDDVLMNANGPVHFAAATKQAAEREMGFDRLVVDANHLQEMLQGLVGLLVQQEVEAFQVVDIQRRRRLLLVTFAEAAHRPACCRQQQKKPGEQKCRFSRHRTTAGCAMN